MKELYLIGNWKMNPTSEREAKSLWKDIERTAPKRGVRTVVCPPFPYISLFKSSSSLALGAQDCFWEQDGPYTGGVSPAILKNLGCEYVIIGHSERREYFGDTDININKKLIAALKKKLRPILAVGEKTRKTFDSRGAHTNELDPIIEEQVKGALLGVSSAQVKNVIVAYEPVWAISKGKRNHIIPSAQDVLMASIYIRTILARLYSRAIAEQIPILYGGSTNSSNVEEFIKEGGIEGVLVGSASLSASEFRRMGAHMQTYADTERS